MTDLETGGAPAPAEATPMPEAQVSETPATSEVSLPEPTPRGSLERAFESVGFDKPDTPEPSEDTKPDRARDEKGKFVSKETAPAADKPAAAEMPPATPEAPKPDANFNEPPSRFSADAKAAWKDAPPAVKAEIHRAVNELQAGIEKYREPAAKWDALKPFHELAARYNTDVGTALARYVAIDTMMEKDFLGGLNEIVSHYGYSLKDVAAHVMGQPVDQARTQATQQNRALRQELDAIKAQMGGVTKSIQAQREREIHKGVKSFADSHPHFDALANDIAFFLGQQTGEKDLQAAYDAAEQKARNLAGLLNPTQQAATPQLAAPKPDPTTQTRKGSLSISGAPSSGSNPANRKPPSSAREALNRAFADVDLG